MHLVFDQVMQLEHGHYTNGYRLIVELTRPAIAHALLANSRHRLAGFQHQLLGGFAHFIRGHRFVESFA